MKNMHKQAKKDLQTLQDQGTLRDFSQLLHTCSCGNRHFKKKQVEMN